jgi:antitoxin component of RelBE/YafQ-DinJ toxin-antitoxin module
MEKKATIISLIILAIIVATACCYIVFTGITTKEYNYVQLEVNPRVEFICDKKLSVVSVQPLNSDARIVLSDLNLIGLDIDTASTMFLDECAKTGYLSVNGIDNATNITVVDGITQAVDVHVAQAVYKYLQDNEILATVTETYEDREMFNKKKEHKIDCSNKYKLISTIIEKDNSLSINDLRKKKEADLVEMVAEEHKNNPYIPTEEELQIKQNLLNSNAHKYNTHKKCISNYSQQEFSKLFSKHQQLSSKEYFNNFSKEYDFWQKQRTL